jgi:hypothetical protein
MAREQGEPMADSREAGEGRRIPWLGWSALVVALVWLAISLALAFIFATTFDRSGALEGMRLYRRTAWWREWAWAWGAAASFLAVASLALSMARARLGRIRDPGCLTLCLVALGLAVMPVFSRPPKAKIKAVCLANVKTMVLALRMYGEDHGGRFPLADDWVGAVRAYRTDDELFICPGDPDFTGSYAYNQALSGMMYDAMDEPGHVVAIFESDEAWLAAGGAELLPEEPRHLGGDNYGFADGHAAWWNRERVLSADPSELRWEPVLGEDP